MTPSASWTAIAASKYVSITTFRKSGERVSTPVWIAPATDGGDILYILTMVGAGRLKRIRNNPSVELAACTFKGRVFGPVVTGGASLLPASHHPAAERALTRKYPLAKRLLDVYHRFGSGQHTYLAIKLTAEFADASPLALPAVGDASW